ncbi:MAG TPA: ABC transporter permease [Pyrinomonadaceae bacterium]|nr:ABC transporter permease [Pyrinomonadaceae bacterium]
MGNILQDVRYGVRVLLKRPAFTAVVVATLALGVGANTAIFSVVYGVLLRPMPYVGDERVVNVESGGKRAGADEYGGVSPADFWDMQEASRSFEHLAAIRGGGFSLSGVENPEMIPSAGVSASFFPVLRAQPVLGRAFTREDELTTAPEVVILSHRLWQRRFGGDPSVVGQTLGDTGATVVGVMPEDFKFPVQAELWQPLWRDSGEMRNRANRYFGVVGRLKPEATAESAAAELEAIAAPLHAADPRAGGEIGVRARPLREWLVREVKSSLLVLVGAVAFVLLVACANVANLMLARAASRRKEMAVRAAMGASRWRLMRQLLTESLLLSLAGSAAGLLLAAWGRDILTLLLPETYAELQLASQARIDTTVLMFTLGVAALTGLVFGLAPAWQASRPAASEWLKESGRSTEGPQGRRTRAALVVAEVAMALVLLVGAGLLVQSFVRLQRVELGFDPRGLSSAGVATSFTRHPTDAARAQFVRQVRDEVANVAGVESAAISTGSPFPYLNFNFTVEGRADAGEAPAVYDSVSADYFRAVGARVVAGREFDSRDGAGSPRVAVVNQTLARRHFAGEDPVGKRVTINYLGQPQTWEVVGVVADINQGEPGKVKPQIFVAYDQQPWLSASLLVRARGDAEAARRGIQSAIWAVDKTQPVAKFESAEEKLGGALAEPRLYTTLLGAFAGVALLLAAVGIYGVMS